MMDGSTRAGEPSRCTRMLSLKKQQHSMDEGHTTTP
jgi:hypothetical protein